MITDRRILTNVIKDRITARIEECLKIAHDAHQKPQLQVMPTVKYDILNDELGGTACHKTWTIRLNPILCYENEDEYVKDIVGHEVAHLVAREVYGAAGKRMRSHGKEWQSVMALFKLKPAVTTALPMSVSSPPRQKRQKRKLDEYTAAGNAAISDMMRRLQAGYRRLPASAQAEFTAWCESQDLDPSA